MKYFNRRLLTASLMIIGLLLVGKGQYMYAKATLAQYLIAQAWETSVEDVKLQTDASLASPVGFKVTAMNVKPWPWADTWPVGKVEVSDLNVTQYIMSDASGESLAFGAGKLVQSAPLAKDGHSLIAGHRDTHFKFLKDVKKDQIITVTNVFGEKKYYRVDQMKIVDSQKDTLRSVDSNVLSLITCYPFDAVVAGGPLRYIVHAQEVIKS